MHISPTTFFFDIYLSCIRTRTPTDYILSYQLDKNTCYSFPSYLSDIDDPIQYQYKTRKKGGAKTERNKNFDFQN